MALGGGIWQAQNKVLPGVYINTVSKSKNASLKGIKVVALPLELNFGEANKVIKLDSSSFLSDSLALFGYNHLDKHLIALREVFKNASEVLVYRMLADNAQKAQNKYATAKYAGIRGNDINIVIKQSLDTSGYEVYTYIGNELADKQEVKQASELKANDLVVFNDVALNPEAGIKLTGGTNGDSPKGAEYSKALNAFEAYDFDVLICPSKETDIAKLFEAYTKRLRESVGKKFQCVVYNNAADYEGIINVCTQAIKGDVLDVNALVYWVAGAIAGCKLNRSLTNKEYNGELKLKPLETSRELEKAIQAGQFVIHTVNQKLTVLEDINSLTTVGENKSEDFKRGQTIRILDHIAKSIAFIFTNNYMGKVPNTKDGRISLWNDICDMYKNLENAGAIEDFKTEHVVINQGEKKDSVTCEIERLNIANAMSKLYLNITVI